MSFRALGAVEYLETPNAHVTLLMYVLAGFADANASCYPSLNTIATKMRVSLSAARNALKLAEDLGFLKREQRTRRDGGQSSNRIVLTFYEPEQPLEEDTLGGHKRPRKAPKSKPEVSHPPPHFGGGPPQEVQGAPSGGGGAFLNLSLNQEGTDVPSLSACANEADAFEELLALWPAGGLDNTDVPAARAAFAAEAASVGDARRLVEAGRAYVASPETRQRKYAPPGLDRWLQRQSYRGRLPANQPKGSARARTAFACAEVRDAVLAVRDERWVGSWLDPCGWDPAKRCISPGLRNRAERLREVAGIFKTLGVSVEELGHGR